MTSELLGEQATRSNPGIDTPQINESEGAQKGSLDPQRSQGAGPPPCSAPTPRLRVGKGHPPEDPTLTSRPTGVHAEPQHRPPSPDSSVLGHTLLNGPQPPSSGHHHPHLGWGHRGTSWKKSGAGQQCRMTIWPSARDGTSSRQETNGGPQPQLCPPGPL